VVWTCPFASGIRRGDRGPEQQFCPAEIHFGHSGSGKGTNKIDGEDATRLRGRRRDAHLAKFGMLFQGSALFDSLPVWQNVAFKLLRAEHMPKKQAKERALETLASVGLGPDVGELWPAELSGGMQKRVALARAIVANPEIVFFDDPPRARPICGRHQDMIVKMREGTGHYGTFHHADMASARKIADRIAMLYEAKSSGKAQGPRLTLPATLMSTSL
jgi:phospholipid/cholesterol/gamma-HCH transport system ATP-binding protein